MALTGGRVRAGCCQGERRHCTHPGMPHLCRIVSPSHCVSADCPGLWELHEQQQAWSSLWLSAAEPGCGRVGAGLPGVLVYRGTVTALGSALGMEGHRDRL